MPDFIQDRNIDVQFGQGQNVKRDKLSMPLGQLSQFKNGWFDTDGALTKRFGAIQLATGGAAQALYTFHSELDEFIPASNGALRMYDPVAAAWNNAAGTAPIYRTTRKPLRRNVSVPQPGPTFVTLASIGVSSPINFDMAYISANVGTGGTGDYLVWCESPNAGTPVTTTTSFVAGIVSVATGAVAGASLTIAGLNPALVNMGGTVALIYAKSKTSGIFYRVLSSSALTWGAETTLQASGGQDDTNYDVVAYSATKIGLVYQSGALQMTVENFTFSAGTFSVVNSQAFGKMMDNVSIGYLVTNGYLAISGGTGAMTTNNVSINYGVWNPAASGTVILAATTNISYTQVTGAPLIGVVRALPVDGGPSAWSMLVELSYVPFLGTYNNTALWPNVVSSSATNFTTGALTNTTLFLGGGLASRPFKNTTTGKECVLVAAQSAVQSTTYLIDATLGTIMGMLAPGSGGGYIPQPYGGSTVGIGSHVPSVSLVGSTIWCPLLTQTAGTAVNGQIVSNLVLDVAQLVQAAPVGVDAGDGLYLAGSFVGRYDGRAVTEHNWFQFPEGVTISSPGLNIASALDGSGNTNLEIIAPANGGAGIVSPMQWQNIYGMHAVNTLIAAGSNNVNLNTNPGVIFVSSTAGFIGTTNQPGTAIVQTTGGYVAVNFTGVSAAGGAHLTGVTGGSGLMLTNQAVYGFTYQNACLSFGPPTILGVNGVQATGGVANTGSFQIPYTATANQLAEQIQLVEHQSATLSGPTVAMQLTSAPSDVGLALPPSSSTQEFSVTRVIGPTQTQPNQHVLFLNMPLGSQIQPGQWFAFDYAGTAQFAVAYFTVAGAGAAPTLPASLTPSLLIPINILASDLPWSVANKTATAICAAITGGTPSGQGYGFYQTGAATPGVNFGGGPYDGSVAIFSGSYVAVTQGIGTFNSTVAGSLSQGVYRYVVTYRATDAQGNVDESGYVTQAVNVYGGQGAGTILTIPPCRITNRLTPGVFGGQTITAEVYRSVANDSVGPLYRVTSAANPLVIPQGQATLLTFTDTMDDLTLQGNAQTYTAGNVALNSAPPAASILHAAQGRLVLAGIEGSPTSYWFSEVGNNGTLKNFSAFFQGTLPDNSEAITAVIDMDAYTVFLRQSSIYYIAGGGPDATGGGTQFSSPQRIPGNIGCPGGLAISHPNGVLFVSAQGVKNLGRDLQITDVDGSDPYFLGANLGAGVEAPLATFVGAILDPQYRSVLFYGPNLTVAWNYVTGQWSEFTSMVAESMVAWYGPDLSAVPFAPLPKAAITYLDTSNNSIWQECSALSAAPIYADKAGPIAMTWQTGRLPLAGPNGLTNIEDVYVNGNFSLPNAKYLIVDDANTIVHVNATDLNAGSAKIGPVWTKNGTVPYNAQDEPAASVGPFSASNYFSLPAGNVLNFTTGEVWTGCIIFRPGSAFATLFMQDSTDVVGVRTFWRSDSKGIQINWNAELATLEAGGQVSSPAYGVAFFGRDSAGHTLLQLGNNTLALATASILNSGSTISQIGSGSSSYANDIFEVLFSNNAPSSSYFTALYNQIIALAAGPGQTISLSCYYDGDDIYSDTIQMTPLQGSTYPSGQAGSPPTSMRFSMRRQEMSFLTLKMIEDVSGYPTTGLPLQITGLTLSGGILPERRNVGPGSNTYAG